jgi:hypothetical protein
MVYFRVASQTTQPSMWKWRSNVVTSFDALFSLLCGADHKRRRGRAKKLRVGENTQNSQHTTFRISYIFWTYPILLPFSRGNSTRCFIVRILHAKYDILLMYGCIVHTF